MNQLDENFYLYADEQEFEWKKSLQKYTERNWLEVFPEAKEILPSKIEEWQQVRTLLISNIKNILAEIAMEGDELNRFILESWVSLTEGKQLLKANRHIARLNRLLMIANPSKQAPGHSLTDELIIQAMDIPIENVAGLYTNLNRRGGNLVGLCPLHEERSPSFTIFTKTNSFWCFGCNLGGNSIVLMRLMSNCSFKQAVERLTDGLL